MLKQILPQQFDNSYRGNKLSPWILGFVVLINSLQSLSAIFNGHFVVMSADGIPLDSYTPESVQNILAVFALLGLSRLIISVVGVLALVRYRSAIPLMLALLVVYYLLKYIIMYFIPFLTSGTTIAPIINIIMFGISIGGLLLSLQNRSI
jgi:hypothetical protein